MPVNRPVGARDSFQAVNAVLQGHIIAPSFLPEEMPVNGPAVAACDDFVLQRFSRYPLSPEFGGPMLPISSIHHIPTAPYYSPQPPYLLPAHLLPAHLYAPIPFAFPNDLSLTKYENSNNVATSSNAASATSAFSQGKGPDVTLMFRHSLIFQYISVLIINTLRSIGIKKQLFQ